MSDLQKQRDQLFNPELYPTIAAVKAKWREVEKEQIAFVESVKDDGLNRMLPFRTTHASLAHSMQHVANHSGYHRGQIALMMRQLDAEPIATDFHVFFGRGTRTAVAGARKAWTSRMSKDRVRKQPKYSPE